MTSRAQVVSLPKWQHRHRRGPPPIERRTHIAIADLLRRAAAPGWLFMHIPNGEYRTPETAALLERMGVLAGAFDLLLIGPAGEHCWLELKRDARAPLSIPQLRFRRALRERGIPHAVACSFDEAVASLNQWGALRPLTL